jgi:channel protein (hemolysin III family)
LIFAKFAAFSIDDRMLSSKSQASTASSIIDSSILDISELSDYNQMRKRANTLTSSDPADSSAAGFNSQLESDPLLSGATIVKSGHGKINQLLIDEDDEKMKMCKRKIAEAKRIARETGKPLKLPLFSWEESPSFLQDNEYIRSGYRSFYGYAETWRSIFMVHNETGNIWTHLIGFLSCVFLIGYIFYNLPEGSSVGDMMAFTTFFMCSGLCFLFSTLFHTHYCHSRQAFMRFGCLDYAGISTMICGSACAIAYFAWYCEPFVRNTWLAVLVVVSSIGIVGPLFDAWNTRAFRKLRTLIYVLSGIISAGPVFHYLYSNWGFPPNLDSAFYFHMLVVSSLCKRIII